MTEPDQKIWAGLLAHLRRHHPTLCRQWFQELTPLGTLDGLFRVRALSDVHRDYLQRQCLDAFNEAIQATSGYLLGVRFFGPTDEVPKPPKAKDQPARDARPRDPAAPDARAAPTRPARPHHEGPPAADEPRTDASPEAPLGGKADPHVITRRGPSAPIRRDDGLVVNPDYGFENFVVGPGNRLAHAACLAVAANPGVAYNPVFIHGGVGLGKTHLLQAICLRVLENNPSACVYYVSCDGFMSQFIEAVQAGEMSSFRHKFRDVDVLVIDDIHFLAKRERTQEEFFHTFNSLYQANKQIILSSDAAPEDIPDLEERLVSRFKWGLVAEVEPPGYETRVAIVKSKASLRGIQVPDDVAGYIASRVDTNIRELEGAITKVQMLAQVDTSPITVALARAALGEPEERPMNAPTFQAIISVVTEFYGIRLAELLSKRRHRSVAFPRQVCMWLARKHTSHSLQEIGFHFGGRDHTTVMHALKAVDARQESDIDFKTSLSSLEERLLKKRPTGV